MEDLYTAVLAAAHFLVDMVCAWAMASSFGTGQYSNFLIYNFCAFALQMPFGALMDMLRSRYPRISVACAIMGALVTVIGALIHPAVLGVGNALFHVGGGMDVIGEDFAKQRQGRDLGIFVAPGALGLYLGAALAGSCSGYGVLATAFVLMMALLLPLYRRMGKFCHYPQSGTLDGKATTILSVCCFAVVILRSWVGLSVTFPWKSMPFLGTFAVIAAASGKCCGGFLAARFGLGRTAAVTLILASLCYLAMDIPAFGLCAIFLFNMSMPLTLYIMVCRLPNLPGFSFGLLTFGLFLGFLPVYFQLGIPMSENLFGAAGSIISCLLLMIAGKAGKYGRVLS